jgi:Holliday junction resolvasome RuvABC endonuclease subunit
MRQPIPLDVGRHSGKQCDQPQYQRSSHPRLVSRQPKPARQYFRACSYGDAIADLIEEHNRDAVVVEGFVYVQNMRIGFTLGQVRGVVIAVAVARGLSIYEYAPRKVKRSVTGLGGAGKRQVGNMIKSVLGLPEMRMSTLPTRLPLPFATRRPNATSKSVRRSRSDLDAGARLAIVGVLRNGSGNGRIHRHQVSAQNPRLLAGTETRRE